MNDAAKRNSHARLERLQAFLEDDPRNFSLLADAFACAMSLGELQTAQQYLDRAHELEPESAFLRHSQASLWIAGKRYGEAEVLLQQLLDAGIDAIAVVFNLAYAKFRQQKYGEARDLLRSVPGKSEAAPESTAMLLRCLHHLREFDDALKFIEQAMRDKTLDASATGVASLLCLDADRPEQAKRLSESALQQNPGQAEALAARAAIALAEQDPELAHSLLAQALERNGEDGRVWSTKAFASMLSMNLDQALEEFKRAVSYMPDHVGTWHGMAWCYLLKKDFAAAEHNLQTAMALDRNFGETHGGLAVVYAMQGRREEAEASIERALRLDSANLSARYARGILDGETADPRTFMRLAERILATRAKFGGGTLADLLHKPGEQP